MGIEGGGGGGKQCFDTDWFKNIQFEHCNA